MNFSIAIGTGQTLEISIRIIDSIKGFGRGFSTSFRRKENT